MGWVEDYVGWAAKSSPMSPWQFHLPVALMLLGSVVGRGVYMDFGSGRVHPSVWCLLVGASSVTKKSSALGLARPMLDRVVPEQRIADTGSPEGLVKEVAELRTDKDYCRATAMPDEFSRIVRAFDKDYMVGFEESMITMKDGAAQTRRLSKERIIVPETHFTFCSATTEARLADVLCIERYTSGFMPRFLVTLGRTTRYYPRPVKTAEMKNDEGRLLGELMQLRNEFDDTLVHPPVELSWNPGAQRLFDDWCARNFRKAKKEDDIVASIYDRMEENALQVAMLCHVSENMTRPIPQVMDEAHFGRVDGIVGRFLDDAIQVYGSSNQTRAVKRVLRVLERRKECTRGELLKATGIRCWELTEALSVLMETSEVKKSTRKGRKGPPAEVYELTPKRRR